MTRTYIHVWCAWCGEFLYVVPGHGGTGDVVVSGGDSHGICPACVNEIQRTVQ